MTTAQASSRKTWTKTGSFLPAAGGRADRLKGRLTSTRDRRCLTRAEGLAHPHTFTGPGTGNGRPLQHVDTRPGGLLPFDVVQPTQRGSDTVPATVVAATMARGWR